MANFSDNSYFFTGPSATSVDLVIKGDQLIRTLGGISSVGGSLSIVDCPNLEDLGKLLYVGKNLFIKRCGKLKKITESLTIGGSMHVSYCSSLEAIYGDIRIGGGFTVRANPCLRKISGTIDAGVEDKKEPVSHMIKCSKLTDFASVIVHRGRIYIDRPIIVGYIHGTRGWRASVIYYGRRGCPPINIKLYNRELIAILNTDFFRLATCLEKPLHPLHKALLSSLLIKEENS